MPRVNVIDDFAGVPNGTNVLGRVTPSGVIWTANQQDTNPPHPAGKVENETLVRSGPNAHYSSWESLAVPYTQECDVIFSPLDAQGKRGFGMHGWCVLNGIIIGWHCSFTDNKWSFTTSNGFPGLTPFTTGQTSGPYTQLALGVEHRFKLVFSGNQITAVLPGGCTVTSGVNSGSNSIVVSDPRVTGNTGNRWTVFEVTGANNTGFRKCIVTGLLLPDGGGGGDTTPPTVPTGLTATAVSASQINLNWNASTDAVGVVSYKVRRAGLLVATVSQPATSYQNTALTASTAYSYTVAARDAAGNESAVSSAVSATTQVDSAETGLPVRYYDLTSTNAAIDAATAAGGVQSAMAAFGTAYGLLFLTPATAGGTDGVSWQAYVTADMPLLKANAKAVLDEFAKYPREFVVATILTHYYLAKSPTFDSTGNPVGGVIVFNGTKLIVQNATDPTYMNGATQHEFGHCIHRSISEWEIEWVTYNPPGFVYQSTNLQPPYTGTHPVGFVSDYARSNIVEDFAETHMYMASDHLHLAGQETLNSDNGVRSKVRELRTKMGALDSRAGAVNFYRDATVGSAPLAGRRSGWDIISGRQLSRGQPPVARFTATSPTSGLTTSWTATASTDPDGLIASYAWDFGDETTDVGDAVTHVYAVAGTYTVILLVTDDDGNIDTATKVITVGSVTTTSDFAVYGDSMANEGGRGKPPIGPGWTDSLKDLIQPYLGRRPVSYQFGIGGSRISTASQLQMGSPMRFTVTGGEIPASNLVEVDITPEVDEFGLYDGGTAPGTGTNPKISGYQLAGVDGSVHRRDPGGSPNHSLTFTRDVTVASPTPAFGLQTLTHVPGLTHRAKNQLFWTGHNNRSEESTASTYGAMPPIWFQYQIGQPYMIEQFTKMLNYARGKAAFLGFASSPVVPERIDGVPGAAFEPQYVEIFGTDGYGGAMGDLIALAGPERWIDVRKGMLLADPARDGAAASDPSKSAYAYLASKGFISGATAQDKLDTGAGKRYPGPSLRADSIGHLNENGQRWVAKVVFDHMVQYGWLV